MSISHTLVSSGENRKSPFSSKNQIFYHSLHRYKKTANFCGVPIYTASSRQIPVSSRFKCPLTSPECTVENSPTRFHCHLRHKFFEGEILHIRLHVYEVDLDEWSISMKLHLKKSKLAMMSQSSPWLRCLAKLASALRCRGFFLFQRKPPFEWGG